MHKTPSFTQNCFIENALHPPMVSYPTSEVLSPFTDRIFFGFSNSYYNYIIILYNI